MKKLLFLMLCLPFINLTQAQQHLFSWKIGAHLGIAQYYGDLNTRLFDAHSKLQQPLKNLDYLGFGLSIESHSTKWLGVRLMFSRTQIVANDRSSNTNFSRSLNVQADIYDANLLGILYFDQEYIFGKKAILSPYLLFGGGFTYFENKGDLFNTSGSRYYYWSDNSIRDIDEGSNNASNAQIIEQDGQYETSLRPLQTEGYSYRPYTWNIAAGIGLKFRISKRVYLHLEGIIHYTGSDYLDDVSGAYLPSYTDATQAYAANPSNASKSSRGKTPYMNDWYSFMGLSIHYSFGQKTYQIRPSIIYTPNLVINNLSDSILYIAEGKPDTALTQSSTFEPIERPLLNSAFIEGTITDSMINKLDSNNILKVSANTVQITDSTDADSSGWRLCLYSYT